MYEAWPGFDQIAQGMGGIMSVTGLPGQGPVRCGPALRLLSTSGAAVRALGPRPRAARCANNPARVNMSKPRCWRRRFLLDFQAARWLIDKEVPGQAGNNHPSSVPTGVYKTNCDGQINIATTGSPTWVRF